MSPHVPLEFRCGREFGRLDNYVRETPWKVSVWPPQLHSRVLKNFASLQKNLTDNPELALTRFGLGTAIITSAKLNNGDCEQMRPVEQWVRRGPIDVVATQRAATPMTATLQPIWCDNEIQPVRADAELLAEKRFTGKTVPDPYQVLEVIRRQQGRTDQPTRRSRKPLKIVKTGVMLGRKIPAPIQARVFTKGVSCAYMVAMPPKQMTTFPTATRNTWQT